jgi:starch-binding outer membrane protein, SusD/RagB family
MRNIGTRYLLTALAILAAAGCDNTLSLEPSTEVEESQAVIDANSARAALAGAYDALQDGSYYGGDFLIFTDLATEDVVHVGTFTTYADMDGFVATADNSDVEGMWDAIYDAIGRANTLIVKVPTVNGLDDDEKNDILGQAYLLRALHYHNLVKLWGPVPIRLQPPPNLQELSNTERATVDQVYTQILSDITKASTLLTNESDTRRASVGAIAALRSRVLLYRKDWAGTVAAANIVAADHELAENFSALFSAEGNDTPEDIWRTSFTATEYNLIGYYYLLKALGGRREVAPTADLFAAFEPGDSRFDWTVAREPSGSRRRYGTKFPTATGAEDLHVIRFAEVLLNKAEALAMLNNLPEAVATYNLLRERAGLTAHTFGTDVSTQQEVLDAIWAERRVELAFEGDRWPDLVRTGRAVPVLEIDAFRALLPIPQGELDVAPKLVQNPGY